MTIDEFFFYWNYYINPELQVVIGISLVLITLIWYIESHDHEIEKQEEQKQEIIPGVPAEPDERNLY